VRDDSTTIRDLKRAVREFCEARDWDQFHGAKDLAIGIASEAGELLQLFRFLSEPEVESLFGRPDDRMRIENELADVAIFVIRLAQRYEIDLAVVMGRKLERNEARYPIDTARGSNRKAERDS
jgi:NTP pyrophosphatase (non-canonical NTP hydrolase)